MSLRPSNAALLQAASGGLGPDATTHTREAHPEPAWAQAQATVDQWVAAATPSPWRIPPPGLGGALKPISGATLGRETLRVGEAFTLALKLGDRASSDLELTVLARPERGAWRVVAPRQPNRPVPIAALERAPQTGALLLELPLNLPPGTWQLAVLALPPGQPWISDPEQRLAWLQEQSAAGAPAASTRIVIAPA